MNSSAPAIGDSVKEGFTLLELLVVLALVSILDCLLLPALARTHVKASGTGCLGNFRQMMVGWAMYMDENDDCLVPASKPGNIGSVGWYPNTTPNENWYTSDSNTNPAYYLAGALSPYIGGHVELYRCPGDVIPSANGRRLRSCSMNSQISGVGNQSKDNNNAVFDWKEYAKGSDLTCPDPKDLFVFADESFWTLNDGWLEVNLDSPDFPDCLAAYHDGAAGLSFADGHAEIHKWVGPYEMDPNNPTGVLGVFYSFGVQRNTSAHVLTSGLDPDWLWLRQHSSCNHP